MLAQPRDKARSMKPFPIDKQVQVENDVLIFVELFSCTVSLLLPALMHLAR